MAAALVLRPDGELTQINLTDGPNLELFYTAIGCTCVDVVALTDHLDMWIDDEGLYTQEVNAPATQLARRFGFIWQPYHGPVVLCGTDKEGNSIDLNTHQVRSLLSHLDDIANPEE